MKSGFDGSFVEKIKENSDIVAIISRYISLTKKGKLFWACCPFHYEKTPSFAVNQQEQYYKCFGCGESGDVIKFIEKFENVDFMSALEILAKHAGIEMPKTKYDANSVKLKEQKDLILKINKEAAIYYNKNLFTTQGDNAFSYLNNRGISKKTIINFGLGVSLGWDQIVKHLCKNLGYSKNELITAGIADEKNGRIFDAFGERIIFPIINTRNEVVGFSGRTMKKDATFAKYKNTRETIIFKKQNLVFGLNLVKKLKQTEDVNEIILVEGQMDVLKLYENGFKNVVACLGTALTENHLKEIQRYADKLIVCFDGDKAGNKAALRSIDTLDVLIRNKMNVKIVSLPEGFDPDEYIEKFGVFEMKKLFAAGQNVIDYKFEIISKKFDLSDNFENVKYINEALGVLKTYKDEQVVDELGADVYLQTISKLSGVKIDKLRFDYEKFISKKEEEVNEKFKLNSKNAYDEACLFYLAALMHKKSYATHCSMEYFYFENRLFSLISEFLKEHVTIGDLYNKFEADDLKTIVNYNFQKFKDEVAEKKFFEDAIKTILLTNLNKEKKEITKKFEKEKNSSILIELKKIDELIRKIKMEDING